MAATQVSTDGWMDRQNAVYTHNGVLFSLKKEANSDTRGNMDEPCGHVLSKRSLTQKYKYCMSPLHGAPQVVKLIKTESRTAAARSDGGGRIKN